MIFKVKEYFLRGYSQYVSITLSVTSTSIIIYKLLIIDIAFIPDCLKNFTIFFIVFTGFVIPTACIVGWLDYKFGSFKTAQRLILKHSPLFQEIICNQTEILRRLDK